MKLLNTNRFYLEGTHERFIHIATIQNGLREYMAFFDSLEKKFYIEAVSASGLEFIEDDSLAKELADYLMDKNISNLRYGDFVPDKL